MTAWRRVEQLTSQLNQLFHRHCWDDTRDACGEASLMLACRLIEEQLDAQVVTGHFEGIPHVAVVVRLPEGALHADPTLDQFADLGDPGPLVCPPGQQPAGWEATPWPHPPACLTPDRAWINGLVAAAEAQPESKYEPGELLRVWRDFSETDAAA